MAVLFSPIGNTDPISANNKKEGSLLHICRLHQPDKIYLYISKEMNELHILDNRFIKALEVLYSCLGKELDYECIIKHELIDVHVYDTFYEDFRRILNRVHELHPNDEILLNISSGTPAMKSALFVLTEISNYKMTPLQVATPEKRSNQGDKNKDKYNLEVLLTLIPGFLKEESRIIPVNKENFNYEIKKEFMRNYIKQYNYPAALHVANSTGNFLPKRSYYLIQGANHRMELNYGKMRECFCQKNECQHFLKEIYIYPGKKKIREILEYTLYLDVLRKRGLYLEFIRGITPLIYELFILVLEQLCNIDITNYFRYSKNKNISWDFDNGGGNDILNILCKRYGYHFKRNNIYSDHLKTIIEHYSKDKKVTSLIRELRSVESKARNTAAHQMVHINDKVLKDTTKYTSTEVMDKFKELISLIDIGITKDHWESYEMMNEKIIESFEELES